MTLYFAYGSNTCSAQMRARCPEARAVGPATLRGYRLAFAGWSARWGGPVATVARCPGARVEGALWAVTEADVARLDLHEGHPFHYARRRLTVESPHGGRRHAQVYVLPAHVPAPPSKAYLTALRRGYAEWGLERARLDAAVPPSPRLRGGLAPVFVYGSLRRGAHNHAVLQSAALDRPATTEPGFELYDLGAYPGMIKRGRWTVRGEVYRVDAATLGLLDRFEGHPRFYQRAPVRLDDGGLAYAYLLRPDEVAGRRRVRAGDWLAHLRARGGQRA